MADKDLKNVVDVVEARARKAMDKTEGKNIYIHESYQFSMQDAYYCPASRSCTRTHDFDKSNAATENFLGPSCGRPLSPLPGRASFAISEPF